MKHWWTTVVRDYLTFTKRDRNGIIFLLFLTVASFVVIPFFKSPPKPVNKDAFIREIASLKISIDSSVPFRRFTGSNDDENAVHYQPRNFNTESTNAELFAFNPNTIDEAGWKKLGVRDKTISTIQKFKAKGFVFRKPEDIKRIYGLSGQQANRLMPFIRLEEKPAAETFAATKTTVEVKPELNPTAKSTTIIIDINEADTTALKRLKGIGTKLATRIVAYRQKLGGFTSVAQIGETYGLVDSTFKLIAPQLRCGKPTPVLVNINEADANRLKSHPYISWNVANAIVRYKEQHGLYKSIDDLHKIDIINDELFTKIAPYLAVQ